MVNKVFVVGFNKCGTTSLFRLFRLSGHKAAHCIYRGPGKKEMNMARRMYRNKANGKPLLQGFDDRTFYCDLEFNDSTMYLAGFRLFRDLDRDYPDSRFILNLRHKADWLRSRSSHRHGKYIERYRISTGLPSHDAVRDLWSLQWDTHITEVREYFADKQDRFVEFNIAEEPVTKLTDAWPELALDPAHWTTMNATVKPDSAGA